jgi:L-alanine-DL-glutamate epimerase-like enolase superfamily enzyme
MRYAVIVKPGPSPWPIIRIDTNQGVYGLGEVRDGAGYQYAMVLKNRLVGENPLKVDYLIQKVQQFGGISRHRALFRWLNGVSSLGSTSLLNYGILVIQTAL